LLPAGIAGVAGLVAIAVLTFIKRPPENQPPVKKVAPVPESQAKQKNPPKNFTNRLGMSFVWIPSGKFMMGSPKDEKGRRDDETQHRVTLTKGFYLGVYEVTQEQWQAVMGNNPSKITGERNLPVDSVSWDDCQEFLEKLSEKEGQAYRLPTEAEWEYACRAGTTTPYSYGETISTDQANYNDFRQRTAPVGSFPANDWGLCDMHGNVREWCADRYGDYLQHDLVDPTGPEDGERHVLRGGSFWLQAPFIRSAVRVAAPERDRLFKSGFRPAKDAT